MVTLKPLLAGKASKLVPPETQSDAEKPWHRQAIAGGGVRRGEIGTGTLPINNFVHWFKEISTNMNPEVQQRALAASRKAASSVFTYAGDNEGDSIAVKTAPTLGDVRKAEYNTEMAAVGFSPQNRDERHSSEDQQLKLNRLLADRMWPDLKLLSPKCTQIHSLNRKGDY